MPKRPKRPCSFPGCPRLTSGRYCEEHERIENKRYEKYKRNSDAKKRYGREWQKLRKQYVEMHPFCEQCYEHGVLIPVDEVHHKKPLAEGGTNDFENLISLCQPCHARIHAERGDRWHNR